MQEYFAGTYLVKDRNDKESIANKKLISYSSYWRNALLFALGYIEMERNYMEPEIGELCEQMNGIAKFPKKFVQYIGFTIYNAKKYTSKQNSNPYDMAAAHYRYALLIPKTIKENIKAQNVANIPDEVAAQPIGGLSVMYTHNTYPSVAQSLKCPMWMVSDTYSKMRQYNNEYLEENQITVNNGLSNDYKAALENYKIFAKDFISRAEAL